MDTASDSRRQMFFSLRGISSLSKHLVTWVLRAEQYSSQSSRKLQSRPIGFLDMLIDFCIDLRLLRPMEALHMHVALCHGTSRLLQEGLRLSVFKT